MTRYFSIFAFLYLAAAARAADLPADSKHSFPVAGISLLTPIGSGYANTLPAGVLFEYWTADKSLGCTAMVSPVNNSTADQVASQLAQQIHGMKEAWDDNIDGTPAFRVNAPVQIGKCSARTSLVTVQNGRAVVITAFGADSAASEDMARHIARSTSLSAPESPADHTDFSPKTGFSFGDSSGRVVISAPEWLHVVKTDGKQVMLSGFDFTAGKESFTAALSFSDVPEQMSTAEFAVHLTAQMKARFNIKVNELWSSLPEDGRFYMTPALQPLTLSEGQPSVYKIGLIKAAPGRMLNMVFMIKTDDANQKRAYTDLASAIIKNVKIATLPSTTVAPAGPPAAAAAAGN